MRYVGATTAELSVYTMVTQAPEDQCICPSVRPQLAGERPELPPATNAHTLAGVAALRLHCGCCGCSAGLAVEVPSWRSLLRTRCAVHLPQQCGLPPHSHATECHGATSFVTLGMCHDDITSYRPSSCTATASSWHHTHAAHGGRGRSPLSRSRPAQHAGARASAASFTQPPAPPTHDCCCARLSPATILQADSAGLGARPAASVTCPAASPATASYQQQLHRQKP